MTDTTSRTDQDTTHNETFAIDANGETTLPVVDVLTGRGFVTGKSGSGKSSSVSVIAEELLDLSHPIMIVDTDGEYYGLKEQYEVLHVGADEECDIRIGPEHAGKLATLALDQHVPIILDVSGFLDEATARELIQETAYKLFTKAKKLRRPFLLVVEEIHEYIPESGGLDELGQQLIQIAKRGRKHGLGLVGVSQRPANVKKDFITQANWLLWHRLTWDNDTNVVRRVVDSEHADAVTGLDDGEGLLRTDWDGNIRRVQFRPKETFDAGATPGLEDVERPNLKSVSDDLVSELQEISDEQDRYESELEQKEREVEQLREKTEELEDQLDTAREVNVQLEGATASIGPISDGEENIESIPEINGSSSPSEVASIDAINVESMDVEEMRQYAHNQSELIEDLRAENNDLHEQVEDLTERAEMAEKEVAEQRDRVEELEEYEQLFERRGELVEAIERAGEVLDIDSIGGGEQHREQLQAERKRVTELEEEIERLNSEAEIVDEQFAEKMDFIETDAVRKQIEKAAEQARTNAAHTWDVVFFLADCDEPVDIDAILPVIEVGESSVRNILTQLKEQHIVFTNTDERKHTYRLNVEGMEAVIEQQHRREEMNDFREEVGVQDA